MLSFSTSGIPFMPFKLRAAVRHHIPRQKFRITNWREYEAGLRNRGSLTVWFSNEAIAAWKGLPSGKQGGQLRYSELAIETALTLRVVFRLAPRQCEGLIGSIMHMLGIDLAVPDHTTLSRRARRLEVEPTHLNGAKNLHLIVDSTGLKLRCAGDWLQDKLGTGGKRRSWLKLHIGMDAESGEIVMVTDKLGSYGAAWVGMSRKSFSKRFSPAMSSCSTIWAHTRTRPSGRWFGPKVPSSSSCRPIALTSTPSSSSSPKSNTPCEKPWAAPSRRSRMPSRSSSKPSQNTNAQTTSQMQDTNQPKCEML